jgi:hypothetical protein
VLRQSSRTILMTFKSQKNPRIIPEDYRNKRGIIRKQCRRQESNLHEVLAPMDFESIASASSATPACELFAG